MLRGFTSSCVSRDCAMIGLRDPAHLGARAIAAQKPRQRPAHARKSGAWVGVMQHREWARHIIVECVLSSQLSCVQPQSILQPLVATDMYERVLEGNVASPCLAQNGAVMRPHGPVSATLPFGLNNWQISGCRRGCISASPRAELR
jgi:hypothetical protein